VIEGPLTKRSTEQPRAIVLAGAFGPSSAPLSARAFGVSAAVGELDR
jgi:hypothetical protein